MPKLPSLPSPIQKIEAIFFDRRGVQVWIKRDDLLHPFLSGNKYRKLKGVLAPRPLLTLGGYASNHLLAVAYCGKLLGVPTYGIVRGVEPTTKNFTLRACRHFGMQLHFVSRTAFANTPLVNWKTQFHLPEETIAIPMGGSATTAFEGLAELSSELDTQLPKTPDYIICPVGSGGTLAGLAAASSAHIIGIAAVKDDRLTAEIQSLLAEAKQPATNWTLFNEYHQGGIGKTNAELVPIIRGAYDKFAIPLDPIYNGKSWAGMLALIEAGYFPKGATLVFLHTGGLQGVITYLERFGDHFPFTNALPYSAVANW